MRAVVGLALAGLLAGAVPAAGQRAATVPLLDEAYHDLDRLEAFGLVPRGASGLAPYSRGRVAWIVREARALLAARADLSPAAREDLTELMDRLDARFGDDSSRRPTGQVELEAGGGSSPGVVIPYNIVGGVDAVLNPLWSGRGGRVYADRRNVALAGRLDWPLAPWLALSAAYRASEGRFGGAVPGRPGSGVEALSARLVAGSLAIQVGRDAVWTRAGGSDGPLLGRNGPPLDLVRLATDRPLTIGVLGDLDLSLFAADLGPRDYHPHAKLFGALLAARPTERLDVALTLLNKQMGEGAPAASLGERLKDLTWVWGWLRTGVREFSDKSVAVSVAHRGDGVSLFGEMTLNDFDRHRPEHTFVMSAAYRIGLGFPRLGDAGRHRLRVEAAIAGPEVYVHHQFMTGAAVDGYIQGGLPGPDGRAVRVDYGYDAGRGAWRAELGLAAEERNGDAWVESELDRDELVRVRDVPNDRRLRSTGGVIKGLAGGRGGLELRLGVERAWNLGHVQDARAWNRAGLLRVWWGF